MAAGIHGGLHLPVPGRARGGDTPAPSRAGLAAARSRARSGAKGPPVRGLLPATEDSGAALTGPCHSRPLPDRLPFRVPGKPRPKPEPQSTLQRDY